MLVPSPFWWHKVSRAKTAEQSLPKCLNLAVTADLVIRLPTSPKLFESWSLQTSVTLKSLISFTVNKVHSVVITNCSKHVPVFLSSECFNLSIFNSSGQNGRHFADDTFRWSLFLRVQLMINQHWRQAIIGTNADPVHWRIYAALGWGMATQTCFGKPAHH